MTTETLSTASEVWNYLKEAGGLRVGDYDKNLPTEIFESLRSSRPDTSAANLDLLLDTDEVSVEDFLAAFFKVVQPYAEMMVDLLRFYEKAGAKEGNMNLTVRFNFDKDLPPFEFDLDHFRKMQEVWQRVAGTYLANVWNSNLLWNLNGLLRSMGATVRNLVVKEWLDEYAGSENRPGCWPDSEPPPPRSGIKELDETLARAWRVWLVVVQRSKRYGKEREDMRRFQNTDEAGGEAPGELSEEDEPWPLRLLCVLDSDRWAESFARGAYFRAERINELSEPERAIEARELKQKITELFDSLKVAEVKGEFLMRNLQDFLSLPLWKQRHELYSAWISTQVVNALSSHDVEIHCVEGQLRFEFKATHLLTVDTFHPNLHLMAELRSPLDAPRGEGRTSLVQPDYSLITSPITSPECSILEIECKQYRTPSKRKFADALTDYAKARPNAQVVLVNYGPAPIGILDAVDAAVRARTHIIGYMKPNSKSQKDFSNLVSKAVLGRYGVPGPGCRASGSSQIQSGEFAGRISLRWKSSPKDLDLHLNIVLPNRSFEVCFSATGSVSREPWAELDRDVREGFGPEEIRIGRWLDGVYRCQVHKYSDDGSLTDCGASIAVSLGKYELSIECPAHGDGSVWDVFSYSPVTERFEILNRLIG